MDLIYKNGLLYWKDTGFFVEPIRDRGYLKFKYRGKYYSYHRVIWEMHHGKIPEWAYIDHINHNREDNRIENLRLALPGENAWNTRKTKKKTSSKYKGVYQTKAGNWVASIVYDGEKIFIGTFKNEDDAGEAYNIVAEELYKDFAVLNEIPKKN